MVPRGRSGHPSNPCPQIHHSTTAKVIERIPVFTISSRQRRLLSLAAASSTSSNARSPHSRNRFSICLAASGPRRDPAWRRPGVRIQSWPRSASLRRSLNRSFPGLKARAQSVQCIRATRHSSRCASRVPASVKTAINRSIGFQANNPARSHAHAPHPAGRSDRKRQSRRLWGRCLRTRPLGA